MTAPDDLQARFRDDFEITAAAWRRWEAHIIAFLWPVAQRMLDLVELRHAERVLDVGCGTGDTALAAALRVGPAGRVLAVDPAPAMIATAHDRAAALQLGNIEFAVSFSDELLQPPKPFDVVLGRFSFIFCPKPVAALQHVRSLMRRGGRIAVAAWTPLEENPGAAAIDSVLRRHGNLPEVDPSQPGRFQMSSPGELARVLSAAGFGGCQVERVPLYQVARDGAEFWRMSSEMGGSLQTVLRGMSDAQRQAVADEVAAFAAPYERDGLVRIPAVAQVGIGHARI